MDIKKIKELALANGFKLKEQASGNMDLHSYVYEFAEAVTKEATVQASKQWIDVNERMPEQGQKVLIFRPNAHEKPHEDPNFKIATYCGNDIWINSHFEHQITHWMPLTNPLESNP